MRTKKNPEIPMVPKAHLKTVEHQREQYKAEHDCLNEKLNQAYEDGYQMEGKYNAMKTQRDTLIDDIAVLRANNERLERENECEKEWFYKYSCELEHIVKHERDTIKRLERENEQYIKLLKEFNNLINYKLAIHPGSDVYMYYRSELNKLGVK
ncbi:hypothetical protein [Staphylococcus nepalensis]|uniref:hypothetical protein n=1 Tax=Staphylococcus nepalensis TaxID=214473 RepID=UPI001C3EB1C3|nr:hypothetical protein [Staphylococcus nepalensis]